MRSRFGSTYMCESRQRTFSTMKQVKSTVKTEIERQTKHWTIGEEAGKFLGVRKIFAWISPKLPEKILDHFLCDFHVILGVIFSNQSTLCAIFIKSKQVGRHFCSYFYGVCPDFSKVFTNFAQTSTDFAQIFRDFAQIFRDFALIFTRSKHLGAHLHPLHLLQNCTGRYSPTCCHQHYC